MKFYSGVFRCFLFQRDTGRRNGIQFRNNPVFTVDQTPERHSSPVYTAVYCDPVCSAVRSRLLSSVCWGRSDRSRFVMIRPRSRGRGRVLSSAASPKVDARAQTSGQISTRATDNGRKWTCPVTPRYLRYATGRLEIHNIV